MDQLENAYDDSYDNIRYGKRAGMEKQTESPRIFLRFARKAESTDRGCFLRRGRANSHFDRKFTVLGYDGIQLLLKDILNSCDNPLPVLFLSAVWKVHMAE